MLLHAPHNIPLNGDHNLLGHEKDSNHRSKFTFFTAAYNMFEHFSATLLSKNIAIYYVYQFITKGPQEPYNTSTRS